MLGATSTATTVHRLDCYEYPCEESILIVVVEKGSLLKSGGGVYGFSTQQPLRRRFNSQTSCTSFRTKTKYRDLSSYSHTSRY
jgi:hypothetical protein